ncbi:hypothetical protein [Flavobacterium lacustre]|uniref:hypothetical protein n=1 Tax=Flavobacterium lacustre TaxID=3016339 RepID=UPI002482D427|nr:hypothetical protein [Flavobacterium lacustre]
MHFTILACNSRFSYAIHDSPMHIHDIAIHIYDSPMHIHDIAMHIYDSPMRI